jgi:short-subunit dehydrogenase
VSERRVAIVTGASSGIGRALAERAVRAGWNVLAVGRRAERLDELAARVKNATGRIATLTLDLRAPHAPRRIVDDALARFGHIDVLVNNAGGVAVGPISQQSDDALAEQMETHVIVPLALTREALPALRASKGHIFYVGSGVARIPVGTLGAYPAAKAAVRSLARIARNELKPDGIAVTYVDPGAVATEFMTRAGFAGPPPGIAASPYAVARRIFAAFATRRPVVNAVPWQTFFVAVGESLPSLTDALLQRAPGLVGGDAAPPALTPPPHAEALPPASPQAPATPPPAAGGEGSVPPRLSLPSPAPVVPAAPATPAPPPSAAAIPAVPAAPAAPAAPRSEFETALAPLAVRMQKLKLGQPFVRGLLVPGAELELGDVSMRWAGMPNKNERGLTNEVFQALAAAGFLERTGEDRYRVIRNDG